MVPGNGCMQQVGAEAIGEQSAAVPAAVEDPITGDPFERRLAAVGVRLSGNPWAWDRLTETLPLSLRSRRCVPSDWLAKQEIGERQPEHKVQPDREPAEGIPDARERCQKGHYKADRIAHDDGDDNGSQGCIGTGRIPGEPEHNAPEDERRSEEPRHQGSCRAQVHTEGRRHEHRHQHEANPEDDFDDCLGSHPATEFHDPVSSLSSGAVPSPSVVKRPPDGTGRTTDGASAVAGFCSVIQLDPKYFKNENWQQKGSQSGGRLHARVRPL